jgi:hypothetical protein
VREIKMKRKDKKLLKRYLIYRLSATRSKINNLINSANIALTSKELDILYSINDDFQYYNWLLENYDKKN